MTFEWFTSGHQQASLLVIMLFTLSFAGVEPHRGDYTRVFRSFAAFLIVFKTLNAQMGAESTITSRPRTLSTPSTASKP